jgi:tRNA nucleotidyltransferase/poly(A) polymerase
MRSNKINSLIEEEHIKTLFSIFKNQNAEIRLVGGSIRDLFINREIRDIDAATELEPNEVLGLLEKNNIEYDDFAIRYGSIIAYPKNKKIQITSLREDINQLGRHTSVLYTKDWKKDAARRDFTFNALYLGEDCKMYDYYKGHQHLQEKIIKFIGEIEDRIKEDYLRIYRYFRFLGLFDLPLIDKKTQKIFEKYIHESLAVLTNDVIRQEVLKMFNMPYPLNCFYRSNVKFKWVEIVKEHFIKTKYELGLDKCLNKIDNIIN